MVNVAPWALNDDNGAMVNVAPWAPWGWTPAHLVPAAVNRFNSSNQLVTIRIEVARLD